MNTGRVQTESQKQERLDRLKKITEEMNSLIMTLAPLWLKLSHMRAEVSQILSEIGEPDEKPRT